MNKLNVQHNVNARIELFQETCHRFLSKINDPKIVTERLKKDIIKLIIDEVVVEGENIKIFATIPFPNKIEEREISRKDLPGTFNVGAMLGPINQMKMERIWTKHKNTDTTLKPKVFVGMSGGVDSSVSAVLLKKARYNVTGVFIKVWQPEWFTCTWREDRLDAMRVAAKLGIPFITLDLEEEYKQEVVDYMIAEYRLGRTPNPDVMCNKYVKFGGFYKWAMAQGADYVATGHYARIEQVKSQKVRVVSDTKNDRLGTFDFRLLTALDTNKDQSYFLWTLTADQLAHTLFPVGDLEKPEVRKYAEKFGLANADKKDSQGLCFIGKVDVKDFLKRYIEPVRGDVLSSDGGVIGFHDGATFFTIGERHGFTITKKTTHDEAYYVVSKDMSRNTITVSSFTQMHQSSRDILKIKLIKVNILNPAEIKINYPYTARSRYRQALFVCKIIVYTDETLQVAFDKPPESISPGQSLVLYDWEVCLGGGIIE